MIWILPLLKIVVNFYLALAWVYNAHISLEYIRCVVSSFTVSFRRRRTSRKDQRRVMQRESSLKTSWNAPSKARRRCSPKAFQSAEPTRWGSHFCRTISKVSDFFSPFKIQYLNCWFSGGKITILFFQHFFVLYLILTNLFSPLTRLYRLPLVHVVKFIYEVLNLPFLEGRNSIWRIFKRFQMSRWVLKIKFIKFEPPVISLDFL